MRSPLKLKSFDLLFFSSFLFCLGLQCQEFWVVRTIKGAGGGFQGRTITCGKKLPLFFAFIRCIGHKNVLTHKNNVCALSQSKHSIVEIIEKNFNFGTDQLYFHLKLPFFFNDFGVLPISYTFFYKQVLRGPIH